MCVFAYMLMSFDKNTTFVTIVRTLWLVYGIKTIVKRIVQSVGWLVSRMKWETRDQFTLHMGEFYGIYTKGDKHDGVKMRTHSLLCMNGMLWIFVKRLRGKTQHQNIRNTYTTKLVQV